MRRRLIAGGASSELHLVAGHSVHAYRVPGVGIGPPVLLVHGLGGSANGWVRILRGLARDFSAVHALDLPGNGFSPLPASGPLTLEQQLEVLHTFCREVVKTPAFVVGNSLGGALSVILASVHPEDVAALALVAPAGGEMTATSLAELMPGARRPHQRRRPPAHPPAVPPRAAPGHPLRSRAEEDARHPGGGRAPTARPDAEPHPAGPPPDAPRSHAPPLGREREAAARTSSSSGTGRTFRAGPASRW